MKRRLDVLNLLLIAGMVGFALWTWPSLPERIPTHFGIDGQPDAWSDKSLFSWFSLPAVGFGLYLLMGWFRRLLPRKPRWVNLPDQRRLSDLPEAARPPVLDMLASFLALVQTELLLIFGLIEVAMWRTAMGLESQGLMITVLILALTASPVLLVVFFLRLQKAMERGRKLAAACWAPDGLS